MLPEYVSIFLLFQIHPPGRIPERTRACSASCGFRRSPASTPRSPRQIQFLRQHILHPLLVIILVVPSPAFRTKLCICSALLSFRRPSPVPFPDSTILQVPASVERRRISSRCVLCILRKVCKTLDKSVNLYHKIHPEAWYCQEKTGRMPCENLQL